MEFHGTGALAWAKRRLYGVIVEACSGDAELADELIESFAEADPPTLADLRMVAAHAREVAAEIEAEGREP